MPGETWACSSTGYTLLDIALERVSGRSLLELTRARLFDPPGMGSTASSSTITPRWCPTELAATFAYSRGSWPRMEEGVGADQAWLLREEEATSAESTSSSSSRSIPTGILTSLPIRSSIHPATFLEVHVAPSGGGDESASPQLRQELGTLSSALSLAPAE